MPEGIIQQIGQNLFQLIYIRRLKQQSAFCFLELKNDLPLLSPYGEFSVDPLEQFVHIHLRFIHIRMPRFHPGKIKQILNQPAHPQRFIMNNLHKLTALFR
ncbi:hypothetical protein D3C87_1887560 [compost metagenome]